MIKEYFNNYHLHHSDITYDFTKGGEMVVHSNVAEPWRVTIIDTGLNTMTGGRIKRVQKYIGDEPFFLTYGDGVADVNINKLFDFHKKCKTTATVTAVTTAERFGVLDIMEDSKVNRFKEKTDKANVINGGFFVLEPNIFDYIDGDDTVFEREPMERLATDNQLSAYNHDGFWRCMDSIRDKMLLEELWQSGAASWKVWE
jgi:glucose-1-phosphate cytidylyltransferase